MLKKQAREGDRILITKPVSANGKYRKGDRYEVRSRMGDHFVMCYGIEKAIGNGEYIVLEENNND